MAGSLQVYDYSIYSFPGKFFKKYKRNSMGFDIAEDVAAGWVAIYHMV